MQSSNLIHKSNLVWSLVVPMIALIVTAVVILSIYLPHTMRDGALETVFRSNLQVAGQIKVIRGYYTSNVVAKVKASKELYPGFDHMADPKAIPLPATFVQDISDLLQKENISLKLVSPYPWPHRAERRMDDFQTMAWNRFQTDPDASVSREETRNGQRYLRVAVADRMAEPCVACHNNDPYSPKKDWKVNDVRAVMEVASLMEPYLVSADNRSHYIVTAIQAVAAMMILALLLVAWQVSRRTREKNDAVERLRFLAHHDAMTGALKRDYFIETIKGRRSDQRDNGRFALHFIDLDRFKEVNDNLGHAAGDVLIRAAADRLRDVMAADDLITRVGGDEFVIAQMNATGVADALSFGRALVACISPPFIIDDQTIAVSASVGSAFAEDGQGSVEHLLQKADIALYQAKASGRNTCRVFNPAMQRIVEEQRDLELLLRRAVETNGFDLHFQPICDARSQVTRGFEALLRLTDAKGNRISPVAFVPVAEEIGLIGKIGAWVIDEACRFAATLPDNLYVAINLSPSQFAPASSGELSISEVVRNALTAHGVDPARIELEITENLFLERTEAVRRELRTLAELGVSLAMDDFGTGYSSLSYLWDLPFNKIKIDRSFVAAWSAGESSVAQILQTIISLCMTLGLKITAEGIETAEQAAFFTESGCDFLQGFLFSAAKPADHILERLSVAAACLKQAKEVA